MKRLHIHLSVKDLEKNITFYNNLFGQEPTVVKDDYVKWLIDEPAVNFAISNRENREGLNHLGLQTDQDEELQEIGQRLEEAEIKTTSQENTACCYSESNKHWSFDPQGIPWECFNTLKDIPTFGNGSGEVPAQPKEGSACSIPSIPWNISKGKGLGCC